MSLNWQMHIDRDATGKATKVTGTTNVGHQTAHVTWTTNPDHVHVVFDGPLDMPNPAHLTEFVGVLTSMQNDLAAGTGEAATRAES